MDEQEKIEMGMKIISGNLNFDFNDDTNVNGLCTSFCDVYNHARNNEEKLTAIYIAISVVEAIGGDIIFRMKSGKFDDKIDKEKVNRKLLKLAILKIELIKLRIKIKKRVRKNKVKVHVKRNFEESNI